jgi:uncharacterized membrane protein
MTNISHNAAPPPATARSGPLLRPIRIIRARPRLFTSIVVGLGVFVALLPADWQLATRLLVAWDAGVALYLTLAFHLAARAEAQRIRRRARLQDEGQTVILVSIAVAALASLAAIIAFLGSANGNGRTPAHLVFATVTIMLSWALTHVMFALHYAHEFYDENRHPGGGMQFPGGEQEPDYWDFFYFSFVVGMCAQVSDVTVASKRIRRTVFAHSVISFIFNVALLALTVNIAASAL